MISGAAKIPIIAVEYPTVKRRMVVDCIEVMNFDETIESVESVESVECMSSTLGSGKMLYITNICNILTDYTKSQKLSIRQ